MANRRFQDVQALQREVKIITGVIGSGLPDADLPLGVATCTLAAGNLTVALEDKYNDLVGISVTPKSLDGASAYQFPVAVTFTASPASGGSTILLDGDGNINSADRYFVTFMLKNTSVAK